MVPNVPAVAEVPHRTTSYYNVVFMTIQRFNKKMCGIWAKRSASAAKPATACCMQSHQKINSRQARRRRNQKPKLVKN